MLNPVKFFDIIITIPLEHPVAFIASAILLCLSATFSSCETALFSLTPPELNRIRAGKSAIDRIVTALYADLNKLLPSILFCNMAVNVLLYALSAAIGASLAVKYGTAAAFLYGLASLAVVIFFGEVFPKQLAITARITVARLTSVPVWTCYRALAKPMSVLNAIVAACERVVDVRRHDNVKLREEEFKLLMDLSKTDGVISDDEYELIDGIVDLPDVKIRDIMTPRVDAIMVKPDTTREDALKLARICGHVKLPIFDAEKDDLTGWVDLREIFTCSPEDEIKNDVGPYIRKLTFFSEHDRADQVLKTIRAKGDVLMAVVDERGIIIGIVTLQDIMDEVLGRFGDYGNAPPENIRERDDGYVLSGGVSVREWRELFDVSVAVPKSATVGGLVVALLGRPAKRGDVVHLDNVEMTVLVVWRNRVTEVMVRLTPDAAHTGDDAGENG